MSHALSHCDRPILIHLPASDTGFCRLWDLHLTEEEQREGRRVYGVKFSEDGSLLVVISEDNLEMWKASTWECLWSVPCIGRDIDFSHDGLRVLVKSHANIHAYDARSGDALGEVHSMPNSMHDHFHLFLKRAEDEWECAVCGNSLLKNGEYWFAYSDRWLWVVEEGVARRLIHIPENFCAMKVYSGYVAIGCDTGLIVLALDRNPEIV